MAYKILSIIIIMFVTLSIFKFGSFSDVAEPVKPFLEQPVKLIFIHHSVGGRWLAHDFGGLAQELNKHGIYVNDITYGWEPPYLTDNFYRKAKRKVVGLARRDYKGAYNIGDRTDIGHWYEWFVGKNSADIMAAVYSENMETTTFGDHSNATSRFPVKNPGEEIPNEIIMFKSCYPNSLFSGKPEDPPNNSTNPPRNFEAGSNAHTIASAKRIYNDILGYFATRPDKFFVVVTAPPRNELPQDGKIARGFNNWLYYDWLRENDYPIENVFVFDLFNVLTSGESWTANDLEKSKGNHHRLRDGIEEHMVSVDNHVLVYPRDGESNNHPSVAGLQKATQQLVPLLIHRYLQWKNGIH